MTNDIDVVNDRFIQFVNYHNAIATNTETESLPDDPDIPTPSQPMFTHLHATNPLVSQVKEFDRNVCYVNPSTQSHRYRWQDDDDDYSFTDFEYDDESENESESVLEAIERIQLFSPSPSVSNHLKIELKTAIELDMPGLRKYKNCLSTVFSCQDVDYLAVALNSSVVVMEFDPITHMPRAQGHHLETRPVFTHIRDSLVATWQQYPHTINYLQLFKKFNRGPVVAACVDDAHIYIWHTETLIAAVENGKSKCRGDYMLCMDSSCWGIDIVSWDDDYGTHNLVVASDNSRKVKLMYYSGYDNRWYHVSSVPLYHNVPTVAFCGPPQRDQGVYSVEVACGLISREVCVFQFNFAISSGPQVEDHSLPDVYYVDRQVELQVHENEGTAVPTGDYLPRIIFDTPIIKSLSMVDDYVWGVIPMDCRYFLRVDSLEEVFGEAASTGWISQHSVERGNTYGVNGLLNHHKSPRYGHPSFLHFPTIDDQCHRAHMLIAEYHQNEPPPKFIAMCSTKLMALFTKDHLFCNNYIPRLFNPALIPGADGQLFANRLLIYCLVPSLQCCIVATQQGLVLVVRMCQYRGVYGLRPEVVFPSPQLASAFGGDGFRTIAGMTVRDRTVDETHPVVLVYLVYTNGMVVAFELQGQVKEKYDFEL